MAGIQNRLRGIRDLGPRFRGDGRILMHNAACISGDIE
jgi:hypothetical protein